MYGNPEVTTGGKALKFYASVRIDIRKSESIKDGTEVVGNRVKIKVVKNKVAPPFKSCTVDMMYGQGISRAGEVLDRAAEQDIIVKSGAWYSYKGQRIGQGRDNARKYLEDNPEVFDEIEKILREEFLNGEAVPVDVEAMNDTDEEGISLSAAVEGDDDLDLDGEF